MSQNKKMSTLTHLPRMLISLCYKISPYLIDLKILPINQIPTLASQQVKISKFLSRRPWIASRRVSQWCQFCDMNKSFLSLARTVKDYFRLASLFIQWSSNKLMVSWMKWITLPLVPIFLLYFHLAVYVETWATLILVYWGLICR